MLRWAIKARLLLFPADKGCSKQDWHNPTGWGEQTNDASTSPPPCNLPHPPICTSVKCSSWGRVNRHDTFFPNPSPPLPQQMHTPCVHHWDDWMDMILSTLPLFPALANKSTHLGEDGHSNLQDGHQTLWRHQVPVRGDELLMSFPLPMTVHLNVVNGQVVGRRGHLHQKTMTLTDLYHKCTETQASNDCVTQPQTCSQPKTYHLVQFLYFCIKIQGSHPTFFWRHFPPSSSTIQKIIELIMQA